jgi:uncharacterized protein (TIGR00255 family)
MKSMTGYAYKEKTDSFVTVSAEIKCYNSRFLDLQIFLPPRLSSMESWIREYMSLRFSRGKFEVTIRFKDHNPRVTVRINTETARAYEKAIRELATALNLEEEPSLGLILGFEGVVETESVRDEEKWKAYLEPVLWEAANQAEAERNREGAHTEADILSHLAVLDECVKKITVHVPEMETTIKENLKERFRELLGDKIDENRILAETAVLLVKTTVSEELSRLNSHLAEFRGETKNNPSPGKKLDFLCQEINREINTIGSKCSILEVNRAVVEMKNALENIREQLRNVE